MAPVAPSGVDHRNDAHHAHEEEAQASVSLDTPQLRQLVQHLWGIIPKLNMRTMYYRCVYIYTCINVVYINV